MKLLALAKAPKDLAAAAQLLADRAGLTLAEARMRLAAEPPSLLARLPPEVAEGLAASLCQGGLLALAVDEAPAEPPPLAVRRFALDEQLVLTDRAGAQRALHPGEVRAILRGASAVREQVEHTERSRSISLGAAIVTGGLKVTKTTQTTVRSTQEQTEQVVFVLDDESRVAALRESALDFTCLGAQMQPGRTANMLALTARLRAFAPAAYFDERLVRLGRRPLPFVLGDSAVQGGGVTARRSSTAGGLELLLEVLRQALATGMLP